MHVNWFIFVFTVPRTINPFIMKRTAFLLSALLLAVGFIQAQNVFFAGQSTDAVKAWKNNILIYNWSDTDIPTVNAMQVTDNGDMYIAGCTVDTNYHTTACLWKNDALLLTATETGASFNQLLFNGEDIYTVGAANTDSTNTPHAVVWRNGEILFVPGDPALISTLNALAINDEGDIFTAGYQINQDWTTSAIIWRNNDTLFVLEAENAEILDLIYFNDDIYATGYVQNAGVSHATVWKNDDVIFQNDSVSSTINTICHYNDTLYFAGQIDNQLAVWKNEDLLYTIPYQDNSNINRIMVNEFGIFYAGKLNGVGTIWKNGNVLFQPEDCNNLIGVAAFPACNGQTRTLPWNDGFEEPETDWGCWAILDFDGNDSISWERTTDEAATGILSARHMACDNIQEGWLITPPIFLQPNRDSTWMRFSSLVTRPESLTYSGVWASTTDTQSNSFSELWAMDNPSDTWDTVTIDLSDFQGEVLYLAFKYSGHHGHDWYIDDVQLQEHFNPRDTISTFPYSENFDNELNDWLILDEDYNGDGHHWKLFDHGIENTQCLGHDHHEVETLQKGWAISRPLHFEDGMFYTLRFLNTVNGLTDRDYSGVYIADNVDGIPTPNDFTMIFPVMENATEWEEVKINLNAYAGHDIYLAFGYEGYDHDWMIDSLTLTSRIAEYTITVLSDHPEWGDVTGSGTYPVNDTIQIEATPHEGFTFNGWDDEDLSNPRNIIVTEDHTYTAFFAIQQCTISTEVTPEGAGTVEGGGTYDYGSTIHLMARANPGHQFEKWSDGVIVNPRTVTVEGDATYTAEYITLQYEITTNASPENGGTVTGGGSYPFGEQIDLLATPNENYTFLCWNDGIASNPRHLTVTKSETFTALFYAQGTPEYTVTVLSNNSLLGTTTGSGVYPEGTVIQIKAIPSLNASFIRWDDGNTDNPRDITVTSDITLTAHFEAIPTCTITVVSENPLEGSAYGSGTYPLGHVVQIGAVPNNGFFFVGWQDDDQNNPRTITVTENATYTASFDRVPIETYTITVYYDEQQGFVLGAGTYAAGATATLAAVPADGYRFVKWSDGNGENPRTIIVEEDLVLAVFFNGTDVPEMAEKTFDLYPNPANDKIHINGIEGQNKVEIFNLFGTSVKTFQATGDLEINISDLSAGLYIIRIGQHFGKFMKD